MVRVASMRNDIRPTDPFRKFSGGGEARPPAIRPDGGLVRFPCGHTDSEARLAGRLRERRNALWIGCPQCNLIAVAVAIIEPK